VKNVPLASHRRVRFAPSPATFVWLPSPLLRAFPLGTPASSLRASPGGVDALLHVTPYRLKRISVRRDVTLVFFSSFPFRTFPPPLPPPPRCVVSQGRRLGPLCRRRRPGRPEHVNRRQSRLFLSDFPSFPLTGSVFFLLRHPDRRTALAV